MVCLRNMCMATLNKGDNGSHNNNNTENTNVKVHNIFHGEITLHVEQIVNTEQLQHYIP